MYEETPGIYCGFRHGQITFQHCFRNLEPTGEERYEVEGEKIHSSAGNTVHCVNIPKLESSERQHAFYELRALKTLSGY